MSILLRSKNLLRTLRISKSKQSVPMIETFARVTRRLVENSCAKPESFPFALPSFFPSMPLEGFTRIVKDTRAQIYRLENIERSVIIVRYRMKSEKDRRRGTDDRTEGRNVNGLFTAHRLEAARRTVNFPT